MTNRRPMQVHPDFHKEMVGLRKRLLKQLGDERKASYTKITEAMGKTSIFKEVEEMLLGVSIKKEFALKIDRRRT